jgi:hypothetical protein
VSRLSYKTLIIVLLFLLIPIIFLLKVNQKPVKTLATWWNDSWTYRVAINISNSGTSETNTQVKILDNYDLSTLTVAGKIQSNLDDLRFTDTNGELIDYWIEDSTNNSVDIWGIIPSIPSGGTNIYMYYGNSSATSVSSTSNMTIGGTMTFINGYRIHTFDSSGTLVNATNTNIEILVVAGGGGGAAFTGGGGGAGGLIYDSSYSVTAKSYTVTVGAGGSGQIGTANPGNGSDGQNSNFDTLTAIGGGGGGTNSGTGRNGGSGGGAGHNNTTGGTGTIGQGHDGIGGHTTAPNYGAGGGGGAGTVGGTPTNTAAGNGGDGLSYSISGSSVYYAGGGGGGTYMGGTLGQGGLGGGGNAPAENATPNTGGGGGGQRNNLANGGNGGSGVIIIRYLSASVNPPATEEINTKGINIGGTGNETPAGSLIAYYKFDEAYGSVANNSGSAGNSINGTFGSGTSSPSWVALGKVNKALSFDGIADFIDVGTAPSLNINNAITISAWIKQNAWNNYPAIISKGYATAGGYSLHIRSDNTLWFELDEANGTRHFYNPTNTAFANSVWNHVVATYDGTIQRVFLNGVQIGTGLNGTFAIGTVTNPLLIGKLSGYGHFNGLIDEVKIYNYALSSDEIKTDYNQSSSAVFGVTNLTVGNTSTSLDYCLPGDTSSLCSVPIIEWKFEEGTGTTAYDNSGNNNSGIFGTSTSAPSWSIGKIGKALNFNYSNSTYLTSTVDPGTMSNGTYSLWVKPSTLSANMGWIDSNFDIFQWTGNLLYFRAGNQSSVSISNWIPNTWHHITLMWNGTNYYGYIDGVQVTNGIQSGSRTGNISLGKVDGSYYFSGSLDQVRVYNYARTPAQIAYDYNQGAPIAWWKFDECQGSIANNSSGLGNTGTIVIGASGTQNSLGNCQVGTSAAWTNGATGKINGSLNFDGTDDYVTVPSSSTIDPTTAWTLSAWVKRATTGTQHSIVEKYDWLTSKGSYFMRITSGNLLLAGTVNGTSSDNCGTTLTQINSGTWYHLTATFDSTTNTIKCYVNGNLEVTNTNATVDPPESDTTMKIGCRGNDCGTPMNGQIDDLRIYNYALTAIQIKTLYNGGAINFN